MIKIHYPIFFVIVINQLHFDTIQCLVYQSDTSEGVAYLHCCKPYLSTGKLAIEQV